MRTKSRKLFLYVLWFKQRDFILTSWRAASFNSILKTFIWLTCCMEGLQPQCFEMQAQKVPEFIFLGRTQNSVDMTSIWHRFLFHKIFRKLTYHIYFNDILLHKHEVMHSCGTYDYQTNYEQRNKLTEAKKSRPYIAWLFARILCVATGKCWSKCHKNKIMSFALA